MLTDALELPDLTELDTDVCIIGSGPAGLTIAERLIDRGIGRICIIESGGIDFEADTEALGMLVRVGGDLEPPVTARRRQLGGTANTWNVLTTQQGGGVRYLPLQPIDFERRDWLPYSGWPFGFEELRPFYIEAQRFCGLGTYDYDTSSWARPGASSWPLGQGPVMTRVEQFGHSSTFTHELVGKLRASPQVNVLLHANVIALNRNPGISAIETVSVCCSNGRRHSITASVFVLAAGGIENARLLLLSNQIQSAGIGNQNDLVGRFFMDHHNVYIGELIPASAGLLETSSFYDLRNVDGSWIMAKLNLTDQVLRSEHLLNSAVRIDLRMKERYGRARAVLRETRHRLRQRRLPLTSWSETADVLRGLPDLAGVILGEVRQHGARPLSQQARRGRYGWSQRVAKRHRFSGFNLEMQTELSPDPENRVVLTETTDSLGLPMAGVRWKWTELDQASLSRSQEVYLDGLIQAGMGRVDRVSLGRPPIVLAPEGIHHHMGTTRMHNDPRQGVVDSDCRVHGVGNLFVAGSSVFPTSGYANPTLTIVALSVRLADHIWGGLKALRL